MQSVLQLGAQLMNSTSATGTERLQEMLQASMDSIVGLLKPLQTSEVAADRTLAETVITRTMSHFIPGESSSSPGFCAYLQGTIVYRASDKHSAPQ